MATRGYYGRGCIERFVSSLCTFIILLLSKILNKCFIVLSGTKSTPSGSDKTKGVQPESWADAESRSWMSVTNTNDATGRKAANSTRNSTGDACTEKKATMRRLGELHRLLNSRKGSLTRPAGKTQTRMTRLVTSIRNHFRHWTPWRRNKLTSRPPWPI